MEGRRQGINHHARRHQQQAVHPLPYASCTEQEGGSSTAAPLRSTAAVRKASGSCASLPATQPSLKKEVSHTKQNKTRLAERDHGCREAERPRQEGVLAVTRGACTSGSKHSMALISSMVVVSSRHG